MTLQTLRIVALVLLFSETYLVGIVPLYFLQRWYKRLSTNALPFSADERDRSSLSSNAVIQVMLQFGGGVLLATVFTHLMPEIKENFETYLKSNESMFRKDEGTGDKPFTVPVVEIAICLGFFFIFLTEEVIHWFLNRYNEHQNKHQNCYNRDLINKCSNLCSDSHETQLHTESKPISSDSAYVNYGADMSSEPKLRRSQSIKSTTIPTVCDLTSNLKREDSIEENLNNSSVVLFFRGLVIIFAFSVHSIFDGLAIGLQTTTNTLWSMFFAISVHKLVIAFVVSMQLYDQSNRFSLVAIHMALFAVMSPIGILIVISTQSSLLLNEESESNPIVILLTSIATGTLLYIVFYEILQKDRCERISGFIQFLSIFVGFGVMLAINISLSE